MGLIGTIHNEIDDILLPAKHTTPDPMVLHSMLARMEKAGCEYVVMECSSHALDQHRVAGVTFQTAIFTNLTQDQKSGCFRCAGQRCSIWMTRMDAGYRRRSPARR